MSSSPFPTLVSHSYLALFDTYGDSQQMSYIALSLPLIQGLHILFSFVNYKSYMTNIYFRH